MEWQSNFRDIKVFHLWPLMKAVAAGSKPAENFHAEATLTAFQTGASPQLYPLVLMPLPSLGLAVGQALPQTDESPPGLLLGGAEKLFLLTDITLHICPISD